MMTWASVTQFPTCVASSLFCAFHSERVFKGISAYLKLLDDLILSECSLLRAIQSCSHVISMQRCLGERCLAGVVLPLALPAYTFIPSFMHYTLS